MPGMLSLSYEPLTGNKYALLLLDPHVDERTTRDAARYAYVSCESEIRGNPLDAVLI